MANLLKSERVPQSKSKNGPFALAGDKCGRSLPPPPPPTRSHRDTCVRAFCPNSKLNLRLFSFVWRTRPTPECPARQGTLGMRSETLIAALNISGRRVSPPCPPLTPWHVSFYSVGRKQLARACFFISTPLTPTPHPSSRIRSYYWGPDRRHAWRSVQNRAGQLK